jgi:hypothetical protein
MSANMDAYFSKQPTLAIREGMSEVQTSPPQSTRWPTSAPQQGTAEVTEHVEGCLRVKAAQARPEQRI